MRRIACLLALVSSVVSCGGDDRGTSGQSEQVDFTAAASAGDADATRGFGGPAMSPAPSPMPGVAAKRQSREQGAAPHAPPPAALPAQGAVSGQAVPQSMIIRTGDASVEVRELAPAIARVRQLATGLGGFVANTSVQGGRDQVPTATLELKLPAARFDQAVNGLQPLGRVESVNVSAQDVGEEFVDVTARVANARRLEERLLTLLATRTGKLEDVLAVERELARVREEIERYSGRLRFLESRVAMSTLVVTIHEPHPVLGRTDSPIAEAFRDAWRNFVGFVAWIIAASGVVVPLLALAAAVAWGARAAMRRRNRL